MILDKILEEVKQQLSEAKQKVPLGELIKQANSCRLEQRCFKKVIARPNQINLIAEIKKASPSKGLLREAFNPIEIARIYQSSGASALSILTEKRFFQGSLGYLSAVREAVELPILRKDFIIDEYQLYQSVCAGADAVLLIARILSQQQLHQFSRLCAQLNLDVICEVHNEEDLEKAVNGDFAIIGINNRSLDTFVEDLKVSARLIKLVPRGKIVVGESAIKSFADVQYLQSMGVNAVLIGEAFMRSPDIAAKVKEVMGY